MQTALPPVRNVEVLFRTFIIPARITVHTLIQRKPAATAVSAAISLSESAGIRLQRAAGARAKLWHTAKEYRSLYYFSIITCGIYGIYWMIKMNDEVNALAGEPGATTGGMVFLFTLITCGIYGWYWLYKMGERCDRIKNMNGSSNVLYLILGIVGLSIVSYCLIQDTINKRVSQA